MDSLVAFDRYLTLTLHHLGSEGWDGLWVWITGRSSWYPLYAVVIALFFRIEGRRGWAPLLGVITCVALADLLSVHGFKNVFERLRPCHDPAIAPLLREVAVRCGGLYGFVSSHAANGFAMAVFFSAFFGPRWRPAIPAFFTWACVLSYSRVYLGVHFVGDILGGAVLGTTVGWFTWRIYGLAIQRWSGGGAEPPASAMPAAGSQ